MENLIKRLEEDIELSEMLGSDEALIKVSDLESIVEALKRRKETIK